MAGFVRRGRKNAKGTPFELAIAVIEWFLTKDFAFDRGVKFFSLQMRKLVINHLCQSKRAQLIHAMSTPAYYLFITSYRVDCTKGVAFYSLDVGVLVDYTVCEWTIVTRYSEILRIKEAIEKEFPGVISHLEFPCKKFFGRLNKTFQEKRINQLNDWLAQLNRYTQIASLQAFVKWLKFKDKNVWHLM